MSICNPVTERKTSVNLNAFWDEVEQRIAAFDLLKHPFYVAWAMGELTRDELKDYASNYYHHVAAFPDYLQKLADRLQPCTTRDIVLENREEELGCNARDKRTHADLWLDFAEGVGADREEVIKGNPYPEVVNLVEHFEKVAGNGSVLEALCGFYAYESQVPAVADSKEQGLKERYGADDRTSHYFTLHKTYDIHHSRVWKDQISKYLERNPGEANKGLEAIEGAARALWTALDGVEKVRVEKRACCTH